MNKLWQYRLYLGFFIPFLLLKSGNFLQSISNAFSLLLMSIIGFGLIILCSFIFKTYRGFFYSFLLLLTSILFLIYEFLNDSPEYLGLGFFEYMVLVYPFLTLLFLLAKKPHLSEIDYKTYFFIIIQICIILILSGFIRELLAFNTLVLIHFNHFELAIPIAKYLSFLGISFSNNFFIQPTGGMLVLGWILLIYYHKLKVKYES